MNRIVVGFTFGIGSHLELKNEYLNVDRLCL